MRSRGLCTALAAVCAAVLAMAAPATAAEKPPIKLGAILPMTGFLAAYGEIFNIGMQMGVEDVNAAGGVNGSKIELQVEDDQLNPQQSVLLYRKLVNDGAVAVLGPVSGTSWENVAPIAKQMKMPAINYTALKPGISAKPWAVRIHPPDDTMIPEGVAEFVKAFPNVKKIVIAGDTKEASGAAGVEEFKKAAAKHKLEVLDVVEYQTRTTDFSPIVIKIRGLEPDAVFVSSLTPTSLPLFKEMEVQGFDKPVVNTALIWSGPFVTIVGSAGKNVYTFGFNTNEPTGDELHDSFVSRFLKLSQATKLAQPVNSGNATMPYVSVKLVADLMRKEGIDGNTDVQEARNKISEALSKLKEFRDIHKITMRETGDGHIQTHLLKADVEKKIWTYVLPPDQRIME
ncbi:MAG TPA: ABC transporter substrate-binding protein [Alphaproteobacteria bacterium]